MSPTVLAEYFSEVVGVSWRAGWLVLVVAGLRVVVRGRIPAQVWYVAWIVVALRLLIPFSVPAGWSPYNLALARLSTAHDLSGPDKSAPPIVIEARTSAEVVAAGVESPDLAGAVAQVLSSPPGGVLAAVWLAGVMGLLATRAMASLKFRRRLRNAGEAEARVRLLVDRESMLAGIGARVTCVETDLVDAPALFGTRRPRLLFPPEFARQLNDEELRLVVRHELAHWRRRDLLAQTLMQMAVALHWFNPLAWFAARLARTDCELACDEFVLRRESDTARGAYGSTLLKVLGVVRCRRRPGLVVAILEDKQQLAQRVRMIAGYRASTAGRWLGGLFLVALVAAASFTRESRAAERPPVLAVPSTPAMRPEQLAAEGSADTATEQFRRRELAAEHLQATVDSQRRRVDELAQRIQVYKEKNHIVSRDHSIDMVNESLKAANLELRRAETAAQMTDLRLNQIREYREKEADLLSLPFIASSPMVTRLLPIRSDLTIALAKMRERYRELHPDMVAAKNSLTAIETELQGVVESLCRQLDAEHEAAVRTVTRCRQELDRRQREALDLDRGAVEYNQMQREMLTQQQILQSIVARAREVTAGGIVPSTVAPVLPEPPREEVSAPKKEQPLSVVFERKSSGWMLTETRGDQEQLAIAAGQIQGLKAGLDAAHSGTTHVEMDAFFVSVVGAVNSQGAVSLPERQKPIVLDAIARAGGFAPNANRAGVRLIRAGEDGVRSTTVLTEEELMNGNGVAAMLRRGDVVVVPEAVVPTPKYVSVLGAVNRPGRIELPVDRKPTLIEVISTAGGPSRIADLKRVSVTHTDPQTSETRTELVNVDLMTKGGVTTWFIEPGDVVRVPERIL